ncbi:hypothetical protein GCM10010294_06020 [Streptomyces griseoloalbus]|nr:hypothetical protein GCM10010294_06020 [Streptomyces griseoloalbus]
MQSWGTARGDAAEAVEAGRREMTAFARRARASAGRTHPELSGVVVRAAGASFRLPGGPAHGGVTGLAPLRGRAPRTVEHGNT